MTKNERIRDILARPYSFIAVADQDDGGWVVFYPDLPGVMTQADTYDDVAAMAKDALVTWVTAQVEAGNPVPEPAFDVDPDWDWDTARHHDDIPTLTAGEVASELGISVLRVHQLARARHLGEMRGNARLFSVRHLEAMRERTPGRPRKDVAPV